MKVILEQHDRKLGSRGQVVDVADGYARNYLIPKGIAVPATTANMKRLAQEKTVLARRAGREQSEAAEIGSRIDGQTVTVPAKAGEAGRLFGSVTAQQVADALTQLAAHTIDKRRVQLDEPIRSLGSHSVEVRLHPEVKAAVTIEVVAED